MSSSVLRKRKHVSAIRIVLTAFFLAVVWRTFVLDLIIVKGESMLPTMVPGRIALVSRCAYGIRVPFVDKYLVRWNYPLPGDIVLAKPMANSSRRAIKRVFEAGPAFMQAEAGVLTGRGGSIPLDESALTRLTGSIYISMDRMFLVGDNESVSYDSRDYGSVPIEKIMGKVLLCCEGQSSLDILTEPCSEMVDDVSR